MIGDGYTDYEIKHSGLANKFYAFTENVERENVMDKADHVAPSLDEFLYLNKLNTAISYPDQRAAFRERAPGSNRIDEGRGIQRGNVPGRTG